MKRKYFDFNEKKIAYSINGTGNAVFLVHGFTESLDIWESFSEKLSQKYKVICIDLPGHGESECVSDIHEMELCSDILKRCLDINQIQKCVIVGHSMGGYVSLAFTEKYRNILKGLCLFHSTATSDTDEQKANRERAIEVIKNNHVDFLLKFIPDLFAEENKKQYEKEINILIERARKMKPEAIIAAQKGMLIRQDRRDIIKSLDIPVFFIIGKQDKRINFDSVLSQTSLPKLSSSLILENCGHMGYIENQEETLFFLENFIDFCYMK